ncbi:MAG: exodeoxyribonuclease VII large subunit [Armatimonadetes bacterium]|nr:exodeoxyribonuclease VII large subunit [Armatimonadota bacterium]MDE2206899.1 exodeoxyribonuclease VII large subunit [Armatimonadota bacterium]
MESWLKLSEIAARTGAVVVSAFPEPVWFVAEIAALNVAGVGHCYLDLIETQNGQVAAQFRATIWKTTWWQVRQEFTAATGAELRKGLTVLAQGTVQFHARYGLSINILRVDPAFTLGDAARRRQETITRLQTEGLIEVNGRIAMPLVMQRIAVISSAQAAGYGDFCHQLEANSQGFRYKVTLFPALMQGAEAERSIVSALDGIRGMAAKFDVAVIVRGGGSTVDLDAFDGYDLASAIASMPIPVITGIGHQRDDSVADMVAHTRVKTPTGAADAIIELAAEFDSHLLEAGIRAARAARGILREERAACVQYAMRLARRSQSEIAVQREACRVLLRRIPGAAQLRLAGQKSMLRRSAGLIGRSFAERARGMDVRLSLLQERILRSSGSLLERSSALVLAVETGVDRLQPEATLRRGYSISRIDGRAIRSIDAAVTHALMETQLADGAIMSRVETEQENDG